MIMQKVNETGNHSILFQSVRVHSLWSAQTANVLAMFVQNFLFPLRLPLYLPLLLEIVAYSSAKKLPASDFSKSKQRSYERHEILDLNQGLWKSLYPLHPSGHWNNQENLLTPFQRDLEEIHFHLRKVNFHLGVLNTFFYFNPWKSNGRPNTFRNF